jgi:hypothetical protein
MSGILLRTKNTIVVQIKTGKCNTVLVLIKFNMDRKSHTNEYINTILPNAESGSTQ